jgi:hypothetical protein
MCAWSGGNFTRVYGATGWTTDAAGGVGIESGRHDVQDNDLATGIDSCLNKSGQNSMAADLNLGGYRPTNVAAGTAAAPALCVANDTNTGIFQAAAAPDTLSIATGGVERARIASTGNVGIGTTNPATALDVVGVVTSKSTTGLNASMEQYSANNVGTQIQFLKSRGASLGAAGVVSANDTVAILNFYGSDGTNYQRGAYIQSSIDTGTISATSMPGRIDFGTTPDGSVTSVVRMRINADGSVGIGRNGTTAYRLEVEGVDSTSSNFSFRARSSTATVLAVRNDGRVGIGTETPSNQLTLSTDSAAKPTTNTWTISSDERIKTNVQPYTKGLAEICQVEPVTYDYNGKAGIAAGPGGVSIIAQALQPIFPECVGSYRGKLEETDQEETDILNYNGHAITFALINAVKELNAKVEALEAKVQALEAVTEV